MNVAAATNQRTVRVRFNLSRTERTLLRIAQDRQIGYNNSDNHTHTHTDTHTLAHTHTRARARARAPTQTHTHTHTSQAGDGLDPGRQVSPPAGRPATAEGGGEGSWRSTYGRAPTHPTCLLPCPLTFPPSRCLPCPSPLPVRRTGRVNTGKKNGPV